MPTSRPGILQLCKFVDGCLHRLKGARNGEYSRKRGGISCVGPGLFSAIMSLSTYCSYH